MADLTGASDLGVDAAWALEIKNDGSQEAFTPLGSCRGGSCRGGSCWDGGFTGDCCWLGLFSSGAFSGRIPPGVAFPGASLAFGARLGMVVIRGWVLGSPLVPD